ncbi:sigma-54 dependent transcriptional regulator [Burkholderiaceae bacterium DAT-1]|nr:sigma-54 dependent transcriptional regulator [Burkholderiaceae bacterium DAT-1]
MSEQSVHGHILILDDDEDVAIAARLLLRRRFARISWLSDPSQLEHTLQQGMPDVVLLDFNFTVGRTDGTEGIDTLTRLVSKPLAPAVIAMTAYADVPLAVRALKLGATDFVTKPWDNQRLISTIEAALASRTPRQSAHASGASPLLGESTAMRQLNAMIHSVAPTEANILILGENGVGKELVAREIHARSLRHRAPFQAIDMGAVPESTFESELFGHKRGAFTDARQDREGRFLAAQGGTLFLDEIGNMPLSAQARLLTALERRHITPVGGDHPIPLDVRIVSATNLAELKLFDPQIFRTDLLFRLNTIVLRVPPLRERQADIPLLLDHYLRTYALQYRKPLRPIEPDALAALTAHAWPGNIRALRHACERATILSPHDTFRLLDFAISEPHPTHSGGVTEVGYPEDSTLAEQERQTITDVMAACEGNISQAAKKLGLSRAALYRRLEKHGL